jgi:hypothetical protein
VSGYELNDWRERVRTDDPDTSVASAQSVDLYRDREVLRRLFSDGQIRTAREAAVEAAGPAAPISRIESLRRRVSDLIKSGEVIRVGVKNRERLLVRKRVSA